MTAPGEIEIATIDDPAPGPSEVIVAVAAVGLCGTDVHVLAGEHGRLPVVPGHEVAGTVVAAGADVSGVRVGDPVAVDPNIPCARCRLCRRGRPNLCADLEALGVTQPGGAAELMAAPAANCVVLPADIALDAAPLIEPLSCAVHGFDVVSCRPGDTVLVYGAGTMGLLMLQLAKRAGAATVDVVDTATDRLATPAILGCSTAATSADQLDRAGGWDIVIDATGAAAAIADGLARVATGGTFLQFGVASPSARVTVAPYDVYRREITIVGSMAVLHSFARAAELFAGGVIDPDVLITHRRPLTEYAAALEGFAGGAGLKTVVVPT